MKTGTPVVSIIIPTLNRYHFLGETLDSICNQTFSSWECLIIDDGSEDYTEELIDLYIEKDQRIKFYHRPNELVAGANSCRNYGFQKSKGKYIQWFDSDDIFNINYLEHKLKKFSEGNFHLVICNYATFELNIFESSPRTNFLKEGSEVLISYLTGQININTPSILWRKEFLEGYFYNERLTRAQELEFHFRLLRDRKYRAGYLNENLVFVRSHPDSITGGFKKGDLKKIKDDLLVRRQILEFLINKGSNTHEKVKAYYLYLNGFRSLYSNAGFQDVKLELDLLGLLINDNKKFFIWKWNLLLWVGIYKFTRRNYRLEKFLKTMKF